MICSGDAAIEIPDGSWETGTEGIFETRPGHHRDAWLRCTCAEQGTGIASKMLPPRDPKLYPGLTREVFVRTHSVRSEPFLSPYKIVTYIRSTSGIHTIERRWKYRRSNLLKTAAGLVTGGGVKANFKTNVVECLEKCPKHHTKNINKWEVTGEIVQKHFRVKGSSNTHSSVASPSSRSFASLASLSARSLA